MSRTRGVAPASRPGGRRRAPCPGEVVRKAQADATDPVELRELDVQLPAQTVASSTASRSAIPRDARPSASNLRTSRSARLRSASCARRRKIDNVDGYRVKTTSACVLLDRLGRSGLAEAAARGPSARVPSERPLPVRGVLSDRKAKSRPVPRMRREALHSGLRTDQANLASVGAARSIRCSMGGPERTTAQVFRSSHLQVFRPLSSVGRALPW